MVLVESSPHPPSVWAASGSKEAPGPESAINAVTTQYQTPLEQVARDTMGRYFQGKTSPTPAKANTKSTASPTQGWHQWTRTQYPSTATPDTTKVPGVFITLSHRGKTRACWGTLNSEHGSVIEETVFSTLGALTREYRHAPIQPWEWKKLDIQVTLVDRIEPIPSMDAIHPMHHGVWVVGQHGSGVILPGETRDRHHQWAMAREKANLSPGEPFQLYKVIAHVSP